MIAQVAASEGDERRRLESLQIALEQSAQLTASIRELLNAGIDPHWDPHLET